MTRELPGPGAEITDPSSFNYAIRLTIYKLNFDYPPASGSLPLGPALGECLKTYNGTYTSTPGAIVTDRVNNLLFIIGSYRSICSLERT